MKLTIKCSLVCCFEEPSKCICKSQAITNVLEKMQIPLTNSEPAVCENINYETQKTLSLLNDKICASMRI